MIIEENRVPKPQDGPFLFWIRIFSSSSFLLKFDCGSKLFLSQNLDFCEKVGLNSRVYEGESYRTNPLSEQLLFRIPLCLDNGGQNGRGSWEDLHNNNVFTR
jgi:hypothetical protein